MRRSIPFDRVLRYYLGRMLSPHQQRFFEAVYPMSMHHHHSLINDFPHEHNHHPEDHKHGSEHYDGQTPDDLYFGPACYEHEHVEQWNERQETGPPYRS